MKLGIDLRCLPIDGSPGGGIAHAARSVTSAMLDLHGSDIMLFIPKGAAFDEKRGIQIQLAEANRRSLMKAVKEYKPEKLFVPSGSVAFGSPIPSYPWIHDLEIFTHPEWFPESPIQRTFTTGNVKRGIQKAPVVFAVSEYTKMQIIEQTGKASEQIMVTYEGGDEVLELWHATIDQKKAEAKARLASQDIHRPYVLILGTVEPRKHIDLIANLWPDIAAQVEGIDLVIAGKDGWKLDEIQRSINVCTTRLEHYNSVLYRFKDVSEDMKRDLLLGATLTLVPSFAEGFGRSALESLQAGTPILVSDRGAMKEITGEGAWVLNPDYPEQWKESILDLLRNPAKRNQWLLEQSQHLDLFDWSKVAKTILDRMS